MRLATITKWITRLCWLLIPIGAAIGAFYFDAGRDPGVESSTAKMMGAYNGGLFGGVVALAIWGVITLLNRRSKPIDTPTAPPAPPTI